MMRVLFACGSHPRHAYIARELTRAGALVGLVIEQRENHVPSPPQHLNDELTDLFRTHFQRREDAEHRFFSDATFPDVTTLKVDKSELNSPAVKQFIERINPDVFISYGVHILSPDTLATITGEAWNIHGGLSPWYRGCITHFWPSYFLEPQMTGMTVHDLTAELDAGPVIHQNVAPMVRGDGLHDVACRAVKGIAEELGKLLEIHSQSCILERHHHTTSGRIWRSTDWHPSHLKLIYDTYNDRIVDHYLDYSLTNKKVDIFRQF